MSSLPLAAQRSPAEIAKASGSNFLVAFAFLSPGRRRALLAVYAFCRVVDDAVDRAGPGADDAEDLLGFWERELEAAFAGEPRTPLGYALHQAARRFELDPEPLRELCRGVRMDLAPPAYETFDDLVTYMRRVASAVGVACLPVFGADRHRARPYAEELGVALQYVNILRDLREDGDQGRCYLPRAELRRHGVEPAWLRSSPPVEALAPDGPVAALLLAETGRAARLFERAEALLPAADRRALKPARLMGRIYRDLLARVTGLGPEVLLRPRVRCPRWRKLALALFGIY
ncbi:MAG: squalene/phytoene synthase family protein [Planctomycetota bacterium]